MRAKQEVQMRQWEDYKKTMLPEEGVYSAARAGDTGQLQHLITQDNVNTPDYKGSSPLMLAAYHGHTPATEFLLNHGADPNDCDASGNSVLMGAAFKGHLDVVKLLVDHGADIDFANPKGQTALQYAQMFGRSEVVLYFKKKQNQPQVFGLMEMLSGWSSYLSPKRSTK
jgi:ankyrin repeat protein